MYSTQTQQKPSLSTRMAESWKKRKEVSMLEVALYATVGVIVVLILLVIVGAFLHVSGIHEGSVVGKDYTPETTSMQCNSYDGKTTICTPVTYPETWNVKIEKDGDKNSFSIPQDKWDTINEGDYLTFDGESLTSVTTQ
jgi:hypothetical protein